MQKNQQKNKNSLALYSYSVYVIRCQNEKGGTMKIVSVYLNESEWQDFELVKAALERRSNSDAVRAMISFCKKNLPKNILGTNKNGRKNA